MSNKKMVVDSRALFPTIELTEEMDTYIKENNKNEEFHTYIYIHTMDGAILIRYPGATIGRITVNDNHEIEEILLYESVEEKFELYKPEVTDIFKKYIRRKLFIK